MAYTFYLESKYRSWGRSVNYFNFQLPDGTEFIVSDEWMVVSQGDKRTGMQRLIFLKRNNYANSYRVTIQVSSSSTKASGEIVLMRETNPQRTSIIILLSDFTKLCYSLQKTVILEGVEINERLINDTLKYKVTIIRLAESQNGIKIASKRDKILIMSDQLNSLLNTGDFADFIIADDKGRCMIKAHRNILAARSVYFRYMFKNNWRENEENRIVFCDRGDAEMRAIKEMLHYIYAGVVKPMKTSDMFYLYTISDQFLLDDLKKFLSEELRKRLNAETAVTIYILAGYVFDTNLKCSSLDFIRGNFDNILNSQFWRAFQNNEGEYSGILDYEETKKTIYAVFNSREN